MSSSLAERLSQCIGYRFEGPYLVIHNECGEPLRIEAVEVRYYISVFREELDVRGRREIRERISVGKTLSSGGILDIYFGPVENVVDVEVIVSVGDAEYRVKPRRLETS